MPFYYILLHEHFQLITCVFNQAGSICYLSHCAMCSEAVETNTIIKASNKNNSVWKKANDVRQKRLLLVEYNVCHETVAINYQHRKWI